MELQTCLFLTTLVACGADIRPAGWLDKVVAHWKKSFIGDFEQLGPFNLDASIEPAPPGYKDSPDWDFESVSRMLALLSVSETGQPALNSLRRMIAPTRRMMMDVPGLAVGYIPQSLFNNRRGYYQSGVNDRRGMANYRKRKGTYYNRKDMADHWKSMANNRKGMANNRKGVANNRKGMANNRKGMANSRKGMAYDQMGIQSKSGYGVKSKEKMLEKRIKEKQLSDFQMSFSWFPSMKDQIPNDIYYDEAQDSYDDDATTVTAEYEFYDPLAVSSDENAIVLLRNPVEARLPSARISVKLLKEILEARAVAARVMPSKKTTKFPWQPTSYNSTAADNSTATDSTATDSTATGGTDNGATTNGDGGDVTTPGGGGASVASDEATTAAETPPPEGRKMAVKASRVAVKPSRKKALKQQ